nr:MAG TPA: DNA-directed RNA polymerase [Caudoviricetes sp.]
MTYKFCAHEKHGGICERTGTFCDTACPYGEIKELAPVVHGTWEETDLVELEDGGHELVRTPNAALRCSNCCNCFSTKLLWKDAYCPNCGAKMDGAE